MLIWASQNLQILNEKNKSLINKFFKTNKNDQKSLLTCRPLQKGVSLLVKRRFFWIFRHGEVECLGLTLSRSRIGTECQLHTYFAVILRKKILKICKNCYVRKKLIRTFYQIFKIKDLTVNKLKIKLWNGRDLLYR